MRMSCNGCRILRKGCSENCSIRPCLQWIKSPDSQANATVFLAKFYGRAGLINLINAGPDHLRPAIFRSLLYEACGRIVNPIYGSVGLLWSGTWHLCQAAVEAVLRGAPITPIASEAAATSQGPPLKAYDIRHVSKDESSGAVVTAEPASDRLKVRAGRCRFKRSGGGGGGDAAAAGKVKPKKMDSGGGGGTAKWAGYCAEVNRSDDSSVSHQSEAANAVDGGESKETESMVSAETVELAASPPPQPMKLGGDEPGLELTLGFEPARRVVPVKKRRVEALMMSGGFDGACKTELGLECPA